jgi:hypothetical protein
MNSPRKLRRATTRRSTGWPGLTNRIPTSGGTFCRKCIANAPRCGDVAHCTGIPSWVQSGGTTGSCRRLYSCVHFYRSRKQTCGKAAAAEDRRTAPLRNRGLAPRFHIFCSFAAEHSRPDLQAGKNRYRVVRPRFSCPILSSETFHICGNFLGFELGSL